MCTDNINFENDTRASREAGFEMPINSFLKKFTHQSDLRPPVLTATLHLRDLIIFYRRVRL